MILRLFDAEKAGLSTVMRDAGTPYAHLHICGAPWDGKEYHPGDRAVCMYVGDTTPAGRAEWLAALDRLAALKPAAVVTGHKDPTQGNPPSVLAESRGYIEYYGQLRERALPDQELFDAMVRRYPDWVSRQEFLILGEWWAAAPPPDQGPDAQHPDL